MRPSRSRPDVHRIPLASFLLAAAVAGCATSSPGASSPPTGAVAPPGQTAQPPQPSQPGAATPSLPAVESPLKRRDVPPEGVAAQFGFTVPNLRCLITDSPGPPEPGPDQPAQAQVANRLCIAFTGFDAEQEIIDLVVTGPDGFEISRGPIPIVPGSLVFVPTPAHPKGTYAYVASQAPPAGQTEPLVATGAFEVVPASQPAAVMMSPPGPPGATFQIGLAGFPADTAVPAFLYALNQEANGWVYLTEISPPPVVDSAGEAVLTLQTAPDDPPGRYGVSFGIPGSGPSCRLCATFDVTP